jgi:L-fucose mutarotase
LADAHFPGESLGVPVIRADGLLIADLLDAIMPLVALDQYDSQNLMMMAAVEGDTLDPAVEASYRASIEKHQPDAPPVTRIDRFPFYDRAKEAFAIVMTGDTAKYGNIIVKKGVTPAL